MSELELLDALLAHEEAELLQRVAAVDDAAWRRCYDHKARMVALMRSWIDDIHSARRPGAGGYSRGAQHFHEHGELISAFVQSEALAAMTAQIAVNQGASRKLDTVG